MSRRLLLVDDDEAIRTIARIALERIGGWTVAEAHAGQLALDIAKDDGPFDAILLDVRMPGLDGPGTFARLREQPGCAATPVIFLTASVVRAEREQLLTLGAAGVLAKPFDPVALPGEIDRILQTTARQGAPC
jgi:CheY-like chemotaxis protein